MWKIWTADRPVLHPDLTGRAFVIASVCGVTLTSCYLQAFSRMLKGDPNPLYTFQQSQFFPKYSQQLWIIRTSWLWNWLLLPQESIFPLRPEDTVFVVKPRCHIWTPPTIKHCSTGKQANLNEFQPLGHVVNKVLAHVNREVFQHCIKTFSLFHCFT